MGHNENNKDNSKPDGSFGEVFSSILSATSSIEVEMIKLAMDGEADQSARCIIDCIDTIRREVEHLKQTIGEKI